MPRFRSCLKIFRQCWHRVVLGGLVVCVTAGVSPISAGSKTPPGQINPPQQESLEVAPVEDGQRKPIAPALGAAPLDPNSLHSTDMPWAEPGAAFGYDPSGRRDPFVPVVQQFQLEKVDENLPPLQRVNLIDLNLIAIVWGAYGYTAMVQTPEGYGYTVRRGTRMGQNNGVVSAITERGIIVQERFTDVYGKKQEREHVKLLHPKEGLE
jgi:type IV pilus assembly protein PilP